MKAQLVCFFFLILEIKASSGLRAVLVGAEAPEQSEGLALGVCVCDTSCLETAASTRLIGR